MKYNKNFTFQNERNLTMLVDFYELTMANGYLDNNVADTIAYFDMFFRNRLQKARPFLEGKPRGCIYGQNRNLYLYRSPCPFEAML